MTSRTLIKLAVPLVYCLLPPSGHAQTVDCDAIRSTRIPVQVTQETTRQGQKTYQIVQIFRDGSGDAVTMTSLALIAPDKKLIELLAPKDFRQTRYTGQFPAEMLQDGKRINATSYSGIDPKAYDGKTSVEYEVVNKYARSESRGRVKRTILGKGTATIGPCVLETVKIEIISEWDYSTTVVVNGDLIPDLRIGAATAMTVTNSKVGTSASSTNTLEITTSFKPML